MYDDIPNKKLPQYPLFSTKILAKDVDYDLIIYDNVPGGAGHVKRIMDKRMLVETFELALKKVEQKCCDEDSSCYNCLRNYNNQTYHKLLKRKLAIEALQEIFENI